ncbi:dTDP-4-dehydrorhamnose reductase [Halosquirtibacter laminarini]|uniref:dTDP-4-dehydrorhamnose reductase n=1 Tax=Halosquirtibacter laminarini TaxID=3374600 RepID=A0AC61NQU0_9BACT|nr:dTDP-4-dehydrorhamnose reductase [Prolixibacteraceae bacterium]
MKKKNILITGGHGMLAFHLNRALKNENNIRTLCLGREDCDITNREQLNQIVVDNHIDIIVNCAAYTAVDKAEEEKETADLINHRALQNIGEISQQKEIEVVHISTDYVFDGEASYPYQEDHTTNPQSIYGITKRDGETTLLNASSYATIIRTAWLYDALHANFFNTMVKLGQSKKKIQVVNDQFGTPTYAPDLANVIVKIINTDRKQTKKFGIFHFSNEGQISWYDFAHKIFSKFEITCAIHPVSSEQFVRPAPRPKFTVLDKTKIKHTFELSIPQWETSLKQCVQQFNLNIRN